MLKKKRDNKERQPRYGSDLIVELLNRLGIEYAAFIPGATFRGIHDSIVNYVGNKSPQVIACCHEEISVAIAHGFGKTTGRPMAAITHNIVGLQHASMAIFNAWCDRVPVLVLGGTGPMDTTQRRPWIDWVHTALVQGNQVRDYVKWDDQPHNLASVPASLIRGYRIAMTEPKAPVYLCFDTTIQEEPIGEHPALPDLQRFSPPPPAQAHPEALRRAADLLVKAEAPIIIADFLGRHQESVSALVELAELLAAPVVDKGNRFNFPNTHPLDLTEGAGEFLKEADVILALDVQDLHGALSATDRHARTVVPAVNPAAKVIHISLKDLLIHSWAADYESLEGEDVPISADTSVALPELTALYRQLLGRSRKGGAGKAQRFAAIKEAHGALRRKWLAEAQAGASRRAIASSFLAREIWETIKEEDWVIVNGSAGGWARRTWEFKKPYQYLGWSNGGAGLGYGMGAAIGATLAHAGTGRICVNIQTDGDLLMTPSALWTAAHHRLPLLTVMFNNRSYYNSEQHQTEMAASRRRPPERAGIGTRLDDPPVNFAKMAECFGIYSEGPVRRPEELRPALERALQMVKEKHLPALVDVVTDAR